MLSKYVHSILSCLSLAVLLGVTSSQAQTMRTGKANAFAEVENATGRVTWFTTERGSEQRLSFARKSYFSCKIDNLIFTNNDEIVVNGGYLTDGKNTRKGDTIITTWTKNGIDIMQDVWPVQIENTCQIIVRWRYKNTAGNIANIESQFLLDVQIGAEDGAKTLTKWGYRRRWVTYGVGLPRVVPPFFINFENDLPAADKGFDPGLSGQGFFINSDLGLTTPWRVTIGDWVPLSLSPWGPVPDPGTEIKDNAVLLEFGTVGVAPGREVRGAQTSYGTGNYSICNGNVFALLFYPKVLKYDATVDRYSPNPFQYEAYLFNPSKTQTAANIKMRLFVGPQLDIIGPGTVSDSKNHEITPSPDAIPAEEVTYAAWDIRASLVRNCSAPLRSWFRLEAVSSFGPPSFVNPLPCEYEIELPCTEQDIEAPYVTNQVGGGDDSVATYQVKDDRQEDKGLQKIEYTVTPASAFSNFYVRYDLSTPCTKLAVPVRIGQKDSTIGGCVDLKYTDCANNSSTHSICFDANPLYIVPDTVAPVFSLIERRDLQNTNECSALSDSILVEDIAQHDRGLRTLTLTPGVPPNNMRLVSGPIQVGAARHRFSVEVIDKLLDGSISVRATDTSGNTADAVYTYCTTPDTLVPRIVGVNPTLHTFDVTVYDDREWDRRIDTIAIFNIINSRLVGPQPTRTVTQGQATYTFRMETIDTTKLSKFCLRAWDLAGNATAISTCFNYSPLRDVWPPVWSTTPPLNTNPTRVRVNINDIHYWNNDTAGGAIAYDSGIDSVWFANANNMTVELPMVIGGKRFSPAVDQVPYFDIYVTNLDDVMDSSACITVYAQDSAGNRMMPFDFCYPIQPDMNAPYILGQSATGTVLDLVVTDNQPLDRGLRQIDFLNSENFQPYPSRTVSGDKAFNVQLVVNDPGKSALGRLQALDVWGSSSSKPEIQQRHTSYVDVAVWVQSFELKKSFLIEKTGPFDLPITLGTNDTHAVEKKKISKFKFTLDIAGDPGVTFAGYETVGTLTDGWTITTTPNGRQVTVEAVAPATEVLKTPVGDQSVIILKFNGAESETSKTALITLVPIDGRSVIFNDNTNVTVFGQNGTAVLPAPQGSMGGSSIVVAGSCTPMLDTNAKRTASTIALHPSTPNPVSNRTTVSYTIAKEGIATLRLFNSTGEMVKLAVNQLLKPGRYTSQLDMSSLAGGTYYLRLESGGESRTQQVVVAR